MERVIDRGDLERAASRSPPDLSKHWLTIVYAPESPPRSASEPGGTAPAAQAAFGRVPRATVEYPG